MFIFAIFLLFFNLVQFAHNYDYDNNQGLDDKEEKKGRKIDGGGR
jgi:hypothetical protein